VKRPLVLGAIGLAAATAAGLGYSATRSDFVAIDRCLAANGAWDDRSRRCMPLPDGPVDHILVDKSDHAMWAFREGKQVRKFRIALGFGGLGPKHKQGDGRVPEGQYLITAHNDASAYHLSLRIGYPTPAQIEAADQAGVNPGGDIMIHGLPNGSIHVGSRHVLRDWTAGCIGLTDREIDWLFDAVPDGTPIEIRA